MSKTKKPRVKLVGINGNAYSIMSACRSAAKKAGWTDEQIHALFEEMMEGDYDHLLRTACIYFDVR
jgi:hypothetical protein